MPASHGGGPSPGDGISGLVVSWSAAYNAEWDAAPEAYLAHEVVRWGRSRRLARAEDPARGFKAYLGVQHYDPAHWHVVGEPRAVFFLSLFHHGRTVALRTFPTMPAALAELWGFHARLVDDGPRPREAT